MRRPLGRLTRQAAWMAIIGRGICPTAQSHAWEKAALAQVTETLRFRRMVNASLWQVTLACGCTMWRRPVNSR